MIYASVKKSVRYQVVQEGVYGRYPNQARPDPVEFARLLLWRKEREDLSVPVLADDS